MLITPIKTTNYTSLPQKSRGKAPLLMSFGAAPKIPAGGSNGFGTKAVAFFKSIFQKGEKKVANIVQQASQEEVKAPKIEQAVLPSGVPDKVRYFEDGKTLERVIKYNADKKPIQEIIYKRDGQSVLRSFEKEYSPEAGRLIKEVRYAGTKLAQITQMDANRPLITKMMHYAKDGKTLELVQEYNTDGMFRRIQYRSDGKTIGSMIEYKKDMMRIISYGSDGKTPNLKEEYNNNGGLMHRVYYNPDGTIDQIVKFNTQTGEEKLRITNLGNGKFATVKLV